MRWWDRTWTRLVAADPGLRRLRAAAQVILAVLLAVAGALPALLALGQPPTAVAPAAVVAITSLLAVREGDTRTRVVGTLLMPLSAVAAITLAVAARPAGALAEGVFLVVMFVAVYVRRFGGRASALGMVAFMGYFLALFLQATWSALPAMAGAAVAGAGAALLARFVLLPERPAAAWRRGVQALLARVQTLRHAMRALADQPDSGARQRRVREELLRLNGTTLGLAAGFDALLALPDDEADELRGLVLDVELAAGALVAGLGGLLAERADATAPWVLADVGAALEGDIGQAAQACRELADYVDGAGAPAVAMAVRRLATAAADLDAAVTALPMEPDFGTDTADRPVPPDRDPADATADPAAPDHAAAADAADAADAAEHAEPEPGGLRPTTRTACQVVVAGALSILVGGLVSPGQWFWAVITAFVVFAGAASRGELLVRAWSRTAGTLFGVVAGVLVASVVAGHPVPQVGVVLLCVFLAFYLLPISYGLMTFFVTTMLGVLYGLLGRFSIAFLEIRLLETVIGAVAGSLAALLVLPTRTRGVVAENLGAFCASVAELLRVAAADLGDDVELRALAAEARTVDDHMHTLLASAGPLGSFRFGEARTRHERWRQLIGSCAAAVREFARTAPVAALTSDADTRHRLGALDGSLAELADALAERVRPDAPARPDRPDRADLRALLDRAAAQEGTLVDLVEAVHAGPTALRAVLHQLGRLRGALADVAVELGAAPAVPAPAGRAPATVPARRAPAESARSPDG